MCMFGLSGCRVKPRRLWREARNFAPHSSGPHPSGLHFLGSGAPPFGSPSFEPHFFWVSPSHRLFVSSMVAPIIFRLSFELIGPRWFTLNHQFSPSHLHFPLPSSLPDDDSVTRLLSLPFFLSPSRSSTLLPQRSNFFCNDSKPLRSHSSFGLLHLAFLQLILVHAFLI